jgi:hypothetical protein
VLPDQRRERPQIGWGQSAPPMGLGQDLLQHERVHVDHAVLHEVERQHADLLILAPVARHLTTAGKIDEVVGSVPPLDGVEALVDFAAQRPAVQVAGKEDGFYGAAEF